MASRQVPIRRRKNGQYYLARHGAHDVSGISFHPGVVHPAYKHVVTHQRITPTFRAPRAPRGPGRRGSARSSNQRAWNTFQKQFAAANREQFRGADGRVDGTSLMRAAGRAWRSR